MYDTIAAVSTSLTGNAGINIIRISGSDSLRIAQSIFTSNKLTDGAYAPNFMYLGTVHGDGFNEKAFCVYYKAPYSYTGEDVIEFQCHGGKGVTNAILRLVREKGARPAFGGEFTKRAFLNGKVTLAEAEGVLDMINASSESEINNAYRLMNGGISKEITAAEKEITSIAAMLEAKLDYPEELEEETRPAAKAKLIETVAILERIAASSRYAKTVTDGVDIAIVGEPNAGKSSLLNALIKQDRAIVTDVEGTTRDVLKESVEAKGIKLNFLDTAGIRESGDVIEKLGIERSKKAITGADIVIFVLDTTRESDDQERAIEELVKGKDVLRIANKADVGTVEKQGIKISAKTGENVNTVIEKVLEKAGRDEIYKESVLTNERQIYALENALRSLKDAEKSYDVLPSECVLVDVRESLESLGKITGKNVSEEIIEEVFGAFCVGK